MIFFDMLKKYMIFVQKLITRNLFKIQKKFSHHEKVQNPQLSNHIRFSTQTQGITKIWSKQKVAEKGGIFFVPNCISQKVKRFLSLICS